MIVSRDVARFVDSLEVHELRCLVGLDPSTLADSLTPRPTRPVVQLDLGGSGDAAALIAQAIDKLSHAVAALWPYLWGGEDLTPLRDDALTIAHLPLRLQALADRHPCLSRAWGTDIVQRLIRGRLPRLATASPSVEWPQLVLAFSPSGLIFVVPWQSSDAFVAAGEWLARHAGVSVLVLAECLPTEPAFQRLLFGATTVADAPVARRLERPAPADDPPNVIALPETEGRPHPQSAAELKLYTLIQADADLRPLFVFNRMVPNLTLLAAKADILWREGRLVVEIDGPEHRCATKYRADRQRDATLLLAGWRVLRFTNEDIITDAALALATIREAVRLIEGEGR